MGATRLRPSVAKHGERQGERTMVERSVLERRTSENAELSVAKVPEGQPGEATPQDSKYTPKLHVPEPEEGETRTLKKPDQNRANSQVVASACNCTADEGVHPRGFEPLTFGSVDRCSIQLS